MGSENPSHTHTRIQQKTPNNFQDNQTLCPYFDLQFNIHISLYRCTAQFHFPYLIGLRDLINKSDYDTGSWCNLNKKNVFHWISDCVLEFYFTFFFLSAICLVLCAGMRRQLPFEKFSVLPLMMTAMLKLVSFFRINEMFLSLDEIT